MFSRYASKAFVKGMSNVKSATGGTSLITIQVPAESNMNAVSTMITREMSTASNIRDKAVRKDVISALKSIDFAVTTYTAHRAPANGLVICAGVPNAKSYF